MKLIDTVKLAQTSSDMYGDLTVEVLSDVQCLFIQRTSVEQSDNAIGVTSDATIYLDPTNQVVLDNSYRLEGMYIIAQPFGQSQTESWYQISGVQVGQRKLLNNAIDNIHCELVKVAGLAYVS